MVGSTHVVITPEISLHAYISGPEPHTCMHPSVDIWVMLLYTMPKMVPFHPHWLRSNFPSGVLAVKRASHSVKLVISTGRPARQNSLWSLHGGWACPLSEQ